MCKTVAVIASICIASSIVICGGLFSFDCPYQEQVDTWSCNVTLLSHKLEGEWTTFEFSPSRLLLDAPGTTTVQSSMKMYGEEWCKTHGPLLGIHPWYQENCRLKRVVYHFDEQVEASWKCSWIFDHNVNISHPSLVLDYFPFPNISRPISIQYDIQLPFTEAYSYQYNPANYSFLVSYPDCQTMEITSQKMTSLHNSNTINNTMPCWCVKNQTQLEIKLDPLYLCRDFISCTYRVTSIIIFFISLIGLGLVGLFSSNY